MSEAVTAAKNFWSEAEFEDIIWHDVHIRAIAFNPERSELLFDVDYMLEWRHPTAEEKSFQFSITPATLVFSNVHEVRFELSSYNCDLEVDAFTRSKPTSPRNADYIAKKTEWLWTLECQQGIISCRSVGFAMHLRRSPVLLASQLLPLDERGGFSFARKDAATPNI